MTNATAVTPYLTIKGCKQAISFYVKAFGAKDLDMQIGSDDAIAHAEIQIGESILMLADEDPDFGNASPLSLGNTSVRLNLQVNNADAFFAQAIAAGAEEIIPLADQFYGQRAGRLRDPFGHVWIVSQHLEDVSPDEMRRRAKELFGT